MSAGNEFRGMADRFRAAPEKGLAMIRDATAKAALDTQRVARERAPVDTGYLRSSIAATIDPGSTSGVIVGEVTAGAEYAAYVEHGTSRQRPQPFMRPAYEQARDVWVQMIEQTGGRVL